MSVYRVTNLVTKLVHEVTYDIVIPQSNNVTQYSYFMKNQRYSNNNVILWGNSVTQ